MKRRGFLAAALGVPFAPSLGSRLLLPDGEWRNGGWHSYDHNVYAPEPPQYGTWHYNPTTDRFTELPSMAPFILGGLGSGIVSWSGGFVTYREKRA